MAEEKNEAYLSTINDKAQKDPRILGAHENPGRCSSNTRSARKRTDAVRRIVKGLVFIYSLPKASRLTKTEQFSAVFHANSAESGTTFQVLVKPARQETARLGMVLGKRVTPRAVDRNYVKRLIREEFRMRKHSLGGMDVVVKVLRHLSKAQARQARTELSNLFSKVSRWAA